ncbi:MAG: SLC13 family permease, partial [Planctomycetaceae bacterium]
MTAAIALTLVVLALIVFALVSLRAAPDLTLLGGLAVLLAAGAVSPKRAFEGFANEGLLAVAFLFVVAEGMRQTGGLNVLSHWLLGRPKSPLAAQSRLMLPTAAFSGFMNNTPVVAMMMPVVGDWARKYRLPISQLLLPLSYATILGGLCTLVGTSTTLVVNGLLIEEDRRG